MTPLSRVRERVFRTRKGGAGATNGTGVGSGMTGRTAGPAAPVPTVPPRGSDPVILDTVAWGQPDKTASYLVPGSRNLLIDAGAANTVESLVQAIGTLDVRTVEYIALTHIHPGQAGGVSVLARCYPEATFLVHAGDVAMLTKPDRLGKFATQLVGDRAVEMFGEAETINPDRIRTIVDGDRIDLGDRQVEAIATPGHTAGHLAWLDHSNRALFCGDALGVNIPGSPVVRPTTPPPEFSRRRSLASIERIAELGVDSIWRAHFGPASDSPERECDRSAESLELWCDFWAELEDDSGQTDREELVRRFNASVEAKLEPVSPAVRRSLELIAPTRLNLDGIHADRSRDRGGTAGLSQVA